MRLQQAPADCLHAAHLQVAFQPLAQDHQLCMGRVE